jgi:hypothetical protein
VFSFANFKTASAEHKTQKKERDKTQKNFASCHVQKNREIPEPVWAVGFALEQPLHVVALACSAFRILKRLQQKNSKVFKISFFITHTV